MAGFTDASTTYPCIHARKSVSKKSTIKLWQEDLAHFGFLYTVVMDCVATFKSEEFLEFLRKEQNCSYNWSPVPSCYQRCCQKSDAYFQTSFTEFYQSSKRLFARFPEEFPAHTLIHRKSKNIKN